LFTCLVQFLLENEMKGIKKFHMLLVMYKEKWAMEFTILFRKQLVVTVT